MRSQGENTVMKGGAREAILDIISKQWSPIEVYILVFLILSIVFVREYPVRVRRYADTPLGKSALFAASIFVSMYYSWLNGLFIALFTLLILSISPRNEEGFQDKKASVKIVDNARPWWVEAVLKENPIAFEDDRITTSAIQDGATSNRSNSTTSSP
uniref:Uncharacterized protein n=1 Tax=viral metagenome TaxID=1070528 RepID=A0A6C0K5A0_9ZZZZ